MVCQTCVINYPGLCGSFHDGCGGTLTCTCPADKPVCNRNTLLRRDDTPGVCSDAPVDPTDLVDVSIIKTGPTATVLVGDEFEFRLVALVQQGLSGAEDVVVRDELPDGLELVAVIPGEAEMTDKIT